MNKPLLFICVFLIILGAIIVALYQFSGDQPPEEHPIDVGAALELRSKGMASIENQKPREGIPLLQQLIEEVPSEEPYACQNILVGVVVLLESENAIADPRKFQEQFELAEQQIGTLESLEQSSVALQILKSRIRQIQELSDKQIEACQAATELAPDVPFVWYELFQAYETLNTEEASQKALEAIQQCVKADPENSWAIIQLLQLSVEKESPEVAELIESLQKVLTPFAEGIEQRSRVNPLEILTQTIEAAQSNNWKVAQRNVRLIGNVLRPEDLMQSDRNRLIPNTLEFITNEMSRVVQEAWNFKKFQLEEPIEVSFEAESISLDKLAGKILQCDAADFYLDGTIDLLVLTDQEFAVYSQANDNWMKTTSLKNIHQHTKFALADLDSDSDPNRPAQVEGAICQLADLDVIIYGEQGAELVLNQTEPEKSLESHKLMEVGAVNLALPVDFDLDGDLDLMLCNPGGKIQLWANYQDVEFVDLSARSQLPESNEDWLKAIAVDIDRDVDIDIVVLREHEIGYLENLRHGAMRWKTIDKLLPDEVGYSEFSLVDLNVDAKWELLANMQGELRLIHVNEPHPEYTGYGHNDIEDVDNFILADFDNDGYQDMLTYGAVSQNMSIMRRIREERFISDQFLMESVAALPPGIVEDLDNDGDLDMLNWSEFEIQFLVNNGGNKNHYLKVALIGQQAKGNQASASGRVNHYGWGSLLELKAGALYQARIANRQTTHFGLGSKESADVLRVLWPNGIPQNAISPAPNSFLCEELKLKGSCPYLYTWDGTKFVFSTDLLWAAPVGLQFAEGVLAPTRPWEYLLIEGDQMVLKEGAYEIQITEELWEAAYFDQVELIAVDHPAELSVYSNEKVASKVVPEFQIHIAENKRAPLKATDPSGKDVLATIRDRDEVYAKLYDHKIYQGVTNEHFLELDLGKFDSTQEVKLFLTGWVFPSDTSINVSLGQNPNAPHGSPPFLQVTDSSGNWITVNPSMGFPGGKTKTIVVDLTNLFPTDDHRLRIVTSMELYWDQIFFTVNESLDENNPNQLIIQTLELQSADLHYRGISERILHSGHGPERFDYQAVQSAPHWPPMSGPFTPYGNVVNQLQEADDTSVVMGAGDEMTLRFNPPSKELPAGWKRDFILHNVGYDKDADLNTIYGQASTPIPSRSNPINPKLDNPEKLDPTSGSVRTQSARHFWTMIRDHAQ